MKNVVVIGAGPAGMMAAISAANEGACVTLVEKNEKLGKKLYITGKGRCNLTNACDTQDFFENVIHNEKFLYSAVYSFTSQDTCAFFEDAGLRLKTERGQRVFPASDKSSDVIRTLGSALKSAGVNVKLNCEVKSLEVADAANASEGSEVSTDASAFATDSAKLGAKAYGKIKSKTGERVSEDNTKIKIITSKGTIDADAVIIATGGLSYKSTGSTGDGYLFAEKLGHKIVEPVPSLVAIRLAGSVPKELEGLSLRNIAIEIKNGAGKKIYDDFGEMLFTSRGVSGPVILSASASLSRQLAKPQYDDLLNAKNSKPGVKNGANAENGTVTKSSVKTKSDDKLKLVIDLKPALDEKQLDARILRDFDGQKNKVFKNSLGALLPAKLIPVIIRLSGINPDKQVNEITKEERLHLMQILKGLEFDIIGSEGFEQAVVTAGGVNVKQVDPSTMESKLAPGVYFAGEVLDVDAYTGGFNIQIALSTGVLAGRSAAQ